MCRMIAAFGNFSSEAVLRAAKCMSSGEIADHDHPMREHEDAWGAAWRGNTPDEGIHTHRSLHAIADELDEFSVKTHGAGFLAIHLRRATIPGQQGLRFTHPISANGRAVRWHLMHNGCLPTVYRELGLDHSDFDSAEYYDYITPLMGSTLSQNEVLERLERLEPENTSGNAFLFNRRRFYVVHWFPQSSPHPRFYTLFIARTDRATFVSSEVVDNLAPTHMWQPLPRAGVLEIPFVCSRVFPGFQNNPANDASVVPDLVTGKINDDDIST